MPDNGFTQMICGGITWNWITSAGEDIWFPAPSGTDSL